MSCLDTIEKVLHRRYLAPDQRSIIEEHAGKGGKKLPNMMRKIVSPKKLPYLLYRFSTEKEQELFPFFGEVSGLKQLCDYILFAREGVQCWCLLIEMKEGSGGSKKQLFAAKEFVRYVVTAAQRVGEPIGIDSFQIRLISVHEKGRAKRGEQEQEIEYDQDGWMKLPTQALRLLQLLK